MEDNHRVGVQNLWACCKMVSVLYPSVWGARTTCQVLEMSSQGTVRLGKHLLSVCSVLCVHRALGNKGGHCLIKQEIPICPDEFYDTKGFTTWGVVRAHSRVQWKGTELWD